VARSLRRFIQTGPRRKTSWEVGPQTTTTGGTVGISATAVLLAGTGAGILSDGVTLVRLRGNLNVFLTACDAAGNGFHGAFGIGICNSNAFTAGVASVLTPLADEGSETWLYHRYFGLFGGDAITAGAAVDANLVNPTTAAMNIEVDSKAMRKLNIGDVIYAALDVVEVGTCTMEWGFISRTLIKLP